ncbi:MAG: hypothetical protein ACFFAO_18720 [Candidatus Hermodarchaeota archaeon]
MEIKWKQKEVKEIQKTYKGLELSQEERNNLKFYGDFIANYIPLPSMVIQGIFSFSIRDWEQAHPGKIFAAEARGPNAVQSAGEMNDFVKKRLKLLLKNPEDHQKIEQALDTSLRKFAEIGASGVK